MVLLRGMPVGTLGGSAQSIMMGTSGNEMPSTTTAPLGLRRAGIRSENAVPPEATTPSGMQE